MDLQITPPSYLLSGHQSSSAPPLSHLANIHPTNGVRYLERALEGGSLGAHSSPYQAQIGKGENTPSVLMLLIVEIRGI